MTRTTARFSVGEIVDLLKTRGDAWYGSELVSQIEHALQCATLAEAGGAGPELVTAALLHDLGHVVHELGEDPALEGLDDAHQFLALPFLRSSFPDAVLQPIRLHVDAKRYLCATERGYWESLSPASKRSLQLQGGEYSTAEAEAFYARPYAADAVLLRRWDDKAKVPGARTPDLNHFAITMEECQRRLRISSQKFTSGSIFG